VCGLTRKMQKIDTQNTKNARKNLLLVIKNADASYRHISVFCLF